MPKVVFRFEDEPDVCAAAQMGENLLAVARRAGVVLDAPCNGRGSCGRCRVRIAAGALDAPKSFLIDEADEESGWRLACLSRVCGDVIVEAGLF